MYVYTQKRADIVDIPSVFHLVISPCPYFFCYAVFLHSIVRTEKLHGIKFKNFLKNLGNFFYLKKPVFLGLKMPL